MSRQKKLFIEVFGKSLVERVRSVLGRIRFLANKYLTERLCRGKNRSVKTRDDVENEKTFCAQAPRIGFAVRQASYSRGSQVRGFFTRLGGNIMKTEKSMTAYEEHNAKLLAEAFADRSTLAARLANQDYFEDVRQAGMDTLGDAILALPRVEQILMYKKLLGAVGNGWFAEPLTEQQLKEKWNGGEEDIIDYILGNMRLHLGTYSAKLQQDILIFLLNEMPEKLRAQREEQAVQEAVEEAINLTNDLPYDEQVAIYKDFAEQIKARKTGQTVAA